MHSGSRTRRLRQLNHLVAWLREKQRSSSARWALPPIVCGDFNTPSTRNDATAALLRHLSAYGDYTLWPETGTFPSPLPRRMLDFVFLPAACRHVQSKVLRTLLSDHCPVMVEFVF